MARLLLPKQALGHLTWPTGEVISDLFTLCWLILHWPRLISVILFSSSSLRLQFNKPSLDWNGLFNVLSGGTKGLLAAWLAEPRRPSYKCVHEFLSSSEAVCWTRLCLDKGFADLSSSFFLNTSMLPGVKGSLYLTFDLSSGANPLTKTSMPSSRKDIKSKMGQIDSVKLEQRTRIVVCMRYMSIRHGYVFMFEQLTLWSMMAGRCKVSTGCRWMWPCGISSTQKEKNKPIFGSKRALDKKEIKVDWPRGSQSAGAASRHPLSFYQFHRCRSYGWSHWSPGLNFLPFWLWS